MYFIRRGTVFSVNLEIVRWIARKLYDLTSGTEICEKNALKPQLQGPVFERHLSSLFLKAAVITIRNFIQGSS